MPLRRVGNEFQVNQDTALSQRYPDVAALADGRFVVVYHHQFNSAGSDIDIYAQLVNADGTLAGGTIRIEHPGGTQWMPAVAARLDGGFTTVWQTYGETTGSPIADPDIYGVVTDSAGNIGSRFAIANLATGGFFNPDIATMGDGR